ncbi:hypothetical protein [Breoghania sp.]|uniref:hypothetical protein n=1 Tax=Breoghania sp. TaxID=2065378 RepID=UPI0029CA0F50|nr:hypothetical protein [Breoghania sp.]
MKLHDVMRNPRLKVRRANIHIETLASETFPLSRDLYEITNVIRRSNVLLAKPDCVDVVYRPTAPIKEHFGAIIGDVVNNLRESLDYWIRNAFRSIGRNEKAYFPFSEKREDLETSPRYPKIRKAFPEFAEFIAKNIEPCRDTNLDLWAVTSLCNDNKHQDFLPAVMVADIENINIRNGFHVVSDCSIGCDAECTSIILRQRRPSIITGDYSASVDIKFPKGAIYENKPVIPTLRNMSNVVSQTLSELENFIAPYCK